MIKKYAAPRYSIIYLVDDTQDSSPDFYLKMNG